jgi:predicted double-glycine peptidase
MCWFAGYTMMFRWKGMPETQIRSHIWDTLKAAGIDVEDARRSGLKLKDNLAAAKALGLGANGFGQPVTESDLRQLVRQSPVWCAGQWFADSNHVYVVTGVSENQVEFYDPWYDTSPDEAFESHKRPLDWVLNGDGKARKGLANTFQWYPLQYFKSGS